MDSNIIILKKSNKLESRKGDGFALNPLNPRLSNLYLTNPQSRKEGGKELDNDEINEVTITGYLRHHDVL